MSRPQGRHQRAARQAGFTIMELLVATTVFAVVLLVITSGILQITRVYYKGLTETNTQNVARNVIDTISQAIQFGGGAVAGTVSPVSPGNSYAFCVGNERFRYVLGTELSDNPASSQTAHALVTDSTSGCSAGATASIKASATGTELLSPNMRLANLTVTNVPGTSLYKIDVRVAYGDDDLLYDPSAPANPTGYKSTDAQCRAQAGEQFCAVSELATTVVKRL